MKRTTLQWISLTAAAAVLAAGCGVRPPQNAPRDPGPQASTTGDIDACAAALGNTVRGAGAAGLRGGRIGAGMGAGGAAAGGRQGAGFRAGAGGVAQEQGPANAAQPRDSTAGPGAGGGVTGPADADGSGAAGGGVGVDGAAGAGGTTSAAEITANGIMIGNVALVALPDSDNMPTTPPGGGAGLGGRGRLGAGMGGAPGAYGGGPTAGIDVGGEPGPGIGGAVPTPATPPGRMANQRGGAFDRTATPGVVAGPTGSGNPGAATTPGGRRLGANVGTPGGAGGAAGTPGATDAGDGLNALERIRTACQAVVEIRVVEDASDKARLGEIAQSVREGRPITAFMDDISRMARGARSEPGATNGVPGAPAHGVPAPGATAPVPGVSPIAPTPGGTPAPTAPGEPPGSAAPAPAAPAR